MKEHSTPPLKSRKNNSHVKVNCPATRKIDRLATVREFRAEKTILKLCLHSSLISTQAQVSLPCQFLMNLLYLCLKGIKAASFGHFLGCILGDLHMYEINLDFLLLICLASI